MFFSNSFGFSDGLDLIFVNCSDPLIAFTPYCPTLSVGTTPLTKILAFLLWCSPCYEANIIFDCLWQYLYLISDKYDCSH